MGLFSIYVAHVVPLARLHSARCRPRLLLLELAPSCRGLGSAPLGAGTGWPRLRSFVVPSPHAGAVLLVGWRRGSAPTVSELVIYLCMLLELAPWSRAGLLAAVAPLALASSLRRAVAPLHRSGAVLGSARSPPPRAGAPRLCSARLGSAPLLAGWLAPARLGSSRAVPASWPRLGGRSIASTPQLFRASAGLGKHQVS